MRNQSIIIKYENRYKVFEQYLTSKELEVEERARNWSMAIGLQDIDRLKPPEFLLEQAKANIEIFESNVFTDLRALWRRSLRYGIARRNS